MLNILRQLEDSKLDAHSCIILTYEIDLTLYDGLIYRSLRQLGVRNQIILCSLPSYFV
jgi:hypothetical protein